MTVFGNGGSLVGQPSRYEISTIEGDPEAQSGEAEIPKPGCVMFHVKRPGAHRTLDSYSRGCLPASGSEESL